MAPRFHRGAKTGPGETVPAGVRYYGSRDASPGQGLGMCFLSDQGILRDDREATTQS